MFNRVNNITFHSPTTWLTISFSSLLWRHRYILHTYCIAVVLSCDPCNKENFSYSEKLISFFFWNCIGVFFGVTLKIELVIGANSYMWMWCITSKKKHFPSWEPNRLHYLLLTVLIEVLENPKNSSIRLWVIALIAD